MSRIARRRKSATTVFTLLLQHIHQTAVLSSGKSIFLSCSPCSFCLTRDYYLIERQIENESFSQLEMYVDIFCDSVIMLMDDVINSKREREGKKRFDEIVVVVVVVFSFGDERLVRECGI